MDRGAASTIRSGDEGEGAREQVAYLPTERALALSTTRTVQAQPAPEVPDTHVDRPSPPLLRAGHYELMALLGTGGMGRVFRAKDPQLGRSVALKLIHGSDPDMARHCLREARAQARIEHDNICKIYEAGEIDGQPYIAMQLIEGKSLEEIKGELSMKEKILIVRSVALGLHAAHQRGLIHRDIKPANIMVERLEDGSPHPYVTDFGLAREIGIEGQTMAGAIEGTPVYMAPEQVRGEIMGLDQRTDVYGLGAMLYDLLTGRPPFGGRTLLEVMTQVTLEEPRPLHELNPRIPADLETVVMKCLEKDPARRYPSARALADDLERYLEREPIHARPATLGYVLRKKARKHSAIVGLAGAGLAALIVLGAITIKGEVEARRREALAEQLGQRVTEIELFLRYASALPVHDMAREKDVIRSRMQQIEQAVERNEGDSAGPPHYALGRGHLALQELDEAKGYLEQALAEGYARPEVHYALGLTLGGLYQASLDQAQRIENPRAREAARREAERAFLEPALRHLRESGGSEVVSRTYIDGLVALYEKRYEDAAAAAKLAAEETPWLHEARKLEGDARLAAGMVANDRGQKDEARRELELAAAAYRIAADMASSDAIIHEALAEAWIQLLVLDIWQGRPHGAALRSALLACDDALVANPRSANAFSKRGRAYFHVGYYELRRGNDPRATLMHAITSSRAGLALSPDDAASLDSIGNSFTTIARYERKNGLDPLPALDQALKSLDEAIRVHPTFAWAWNDAGLVLKERALYEAEHGADPRPSIDLAIERFSRATDHDPLYTHAHANMAWALTIRANYELANGRDPTVDAERAVESASRAVQINPQWIPALNNAGWAHLVVAQYKEAREKDPSVEADRAEESFRASLQVNAEEGDTHFGLGAVLHVRALYQMRTGADPAEVFNQARTSLQRAIELDSGEPESRMELGRLEMSEVRRAVLLGQDVTQRLDHAREVLEEGLRMHPRHAGLAAALADVYVLRAQHGPRDSASVGAAIAQGFAAVDKALGILPTMPLAIAVKGALYLCRARAHAGSARKEDARRAQAQFLQALEKNPLLAGRFRSLLEEARSLDEP